MALFRKKLKQIVRFNIENSAFQKGTKEMAVIQKSFL